jgi:agmatine deiminase
MKTPHELGFAMPAEWERHEATWIGWPHYLKDWPGKFHPVPWVFGEMVRKICPGEVVRIHVNSSDHEDGARRVLSKAGVDFNRIQFMRGKTNRNWTRDFGPIFVRGKKQVATLDYLFNAWAKYDDYQLDNSVASRVTKFLGVKTFHVRLGERPIVLEGGALDVNGRGTLLTTEQCLLQQDVQVRNPGLTREDMNQVFRDYFGATNVIWLKNGVAGDYDTNGHVDDLCRFVNATTVVLCSEKNKKDENYKNLAENREILRGARLETGSKIQVVDLPMPAPLYFDGRRLPASYANFYIANAAVLVPTFNDPNDRIALGLLAELVPDRPVVGIHAVDLVLGLGAIHCLTQQQPAV